MDTAGRARVHFTVAPQYRERIRAHVEEGRARLGDAGRGIEVDDSVQSPATDTLAGTHDGDALRDERGRLVLRPGGHGALIRNLDELKADVVYLKNIDNVAPGALAVEGRAWKALLGGVLLRLQAEIHERLRSWDARRPGGDELDGLEAFAAARLGVRLPGAALDDAARRERMRAILDRPLRVCGMVRNEGEPGGGPYWVREEDGRETLQIVEGSQMDPDDPVQAAAIAAATHFNPVDLVCAVRDAHGEPYRLADFVDADAGFLSEKSKGGRVLRALERPGLWNGAMSRWNTMFVEVPILTFNPVKTVLDLLRPEHQPG